MQLGFDLLRTMRSPTVRATTRLFLRPSLLFSVPARPVSTSRCRSEQFHGGDEAVNCDFLLFFSFAVSGSPVFCFADAQPHQTFRKVTSATKTNELVVLVDFFAECVLPCRCLFFANGWNVTQLVWPLQSALASPGETRRGRRDEDGLGSAD